MLSRRDKLYVQPWEERRFQDHRSKVRTALPAIDDRAPPARAHVAVKLKKYQREAERARKIQNDNYSLLQRLTAIMRSKRLDNWLTPQYKPTCPDTLLRSTSIALRSSMVSAMTTISSANRSFRHKVGMFYPAEALGGRAAARAPSPASGSYTGHVKCFACLTNKKPVVQLNKVYGSLPSI